MDCVRVLRPGVYYLLRAAEQVNKYYPNKKFVIVGEGILREEIEKQIKVLDLHNKVLLLGWRKDIPTLLYISDCYVLPSLSEGMPRSIIEAMALAKPVIATYIRGNRELVIQDQTGLLVPPKNSRALAEAMFRIISKGDWGVNMGLKGRKRALLFHNEEKIIETIGNAYQGLIDKLEKRS